MMPPPVLLGLFGGTFDPVHNGHLYLAKAFMHCLELRQMRWIPAYTPPHRPPLKAAPEHRSAMLRAALADCPGMILDERELNRKGQSYTVETILALRAELPGQRLCLLMGSDALGNFNHWHQWEDILQQAHLIIADRPGGTPRQWPPAIASLLRQRSTTSLRKLRQASAGCILYRKIDAPDVSASQVRTLLATGGNAGHLLPAPVLDYIERHGLYQN